LFDFKLKRPRIPPTSGRKKPMLKYQFDVPYRSQMKIEFVPKNKFW